MTETLLSSYNTHTSAWEESLFVEWGELDATPVPDKEMHMADFSPNPLQNAEANNGRRRRWHLTRGLAQRVSLLVLGLVAAVYFVKGRGGEELPQMQDIRGLQRLDSCCRAARKLPAFESFK